ncbi:hypothetical protein C0585_03405 [Candidatus Woesearchaeota archaeon]|nr:MAG: hypothetical protein C0585_03405 [Candidatus Woesearchaeota archaeon]
MKKLFLLSKENLDLSKDEVLNLYKPKKHMIIEDILIFETTLNFSNRLSLTKKVYQVLEQEIEWDKIIISPFKVTGKKEDEKKYAKIIWNMVNNPSVDLKNPKTEIEIIKKGDETFICKLETKISTDWKKRLPHLKPEMSPTSLNPRIAMAMINLTGKIDGKLCDPFCGTGGILVEAGLMNYDIIGFDIDEITLKKAKVNLHYYNIKKYDLSKKDALKNGDKFDVVVTDLPYGKNTKITENLKSLYKNFFEKYYDLCDVMVVGIPSYMDKKILFGNWKIETRYEIYLHSTLSKNIIVLKK